MSVSNKIGLEDAMLLWTPLYFENNPTKGRVEITTNPQDPQFRVLTNSVGSCDFDWKHLSQGERIERFQKVINQMLNRDKITKQSIKRANRSVAVRKYSLI